MSFAGLSQHGFKTQDDLHTEELILRAGISEERLQQMLDKGIIAVCIVDDPVCLTKTLLVRYKDHTEEKLPINLKF